MSNCKLTKQQVRAIRKYKKKYFSFNGAAAKHESVLFAWLIENQIYISVRHAQRIMRGWLPKNHRR